MKKYLNRLNAAKSTADRCGLPFNRMRIGTIRAPFFSNFFACVFAWMFFVFNGMYAANAVDYPVTVTTPGATSTFSVTLGAAGTFYIDCGNGGTLSGTVGTINGNTIDRSSNTSNGVYTCTWDTPDVQTVRFGGNATAYPADSQRSAISFNNHNEVESINGDLAAIFTAYGTTNGQFPRFYRMFYNCTNLKSVSSNLFNGYTGYGTYMFRQTFYGCTGLTSIPSGLFTNISHVYEGMFYQTFYGCTGLGTDATIDEPIPSDLFSGITTFSSAIYLFSGTFYGCTGLKSLPNRLFANITSGTKQMFNETFRKCTGLTSIPFDLFPNVTTGAESMFQRTFYGCSRLTSLPPGLFASVTSGAKTMFSATFQSCSNLTGYVPASLFARGLSGTQIMSNIFSGCSKLAASCSNGMSTYTTGYESYWKFSNNRTAVSCIADYNFDYNCGAGSGNPPSGGTVKSDELFVSTQSTCDAPNGYIFDGWLVDGTDVVLKPDEKYPWTFKSSKTLTAQYIEQFTITYDCGGGGGSTPPNDVVIAGEQFTPAPNTCTPPSAGMNFDGWGISGTNTVVPAEIEFTWTYNESKTFTAQWSGGGSSSIISYDCGIGSGNEPANDSVNTGSPFTPAANTCIAPTGYGFSGWEISGESTTVPAGIEFTWDYSGDKTLFAQYSLNQITISYYPNGGVDSTTGNAWANDGDIMCTYNGTFSLPAAPSKTGYNFDGWRVRGP